MARLRMLTLIAVSLAIITFIVKNRKPSTILEGKGLLVDKSWLTANLHPITPRKDLRPPDQTFLTFPEWFLVFSPAEQADYFKTHTSTNFPYLKHVDQLWKSYDIMYNQVKGNYPFNTGYHVMILVIAGSTTFEYSVKSLYETAIGRVTNTAANEEMTDEDKFNAQYLQRYVNFIVEKPWYEFNFNRELIDCWSNTSFFGPHFMRKMERKYYLTTELLTKSAYGWLIKLGTKTAYDAASFNTAVVVDKLPVDLHGFPEIKNVKQLSAGLVQMDLPRYDDFNPAVCRLATNGVTFKEIAGNNSAIMLTVLTDESLSQDKNFRILFSQPIITKPGLNRIALVTTVINLSGTVQKLLSRKIKIEHIFDY